MLKKQIQGPVEHEVKVTRLKGVGHGVRVLVNGEVNQQGLAKDLLRMEDKCSNESDFAQAARRRNKRT